MVLYGITWYCMVLQGKIGEKMFKRLKKWVEEVKKDIAVLWLASKDERTPNGAHLMCSLVLAYVLSPIDLIPDFIPVIGYLDDVFIIALGIKLAIKWIPAELLAEFRVKAKEITRMPKSYTGAFIILATWVAFIAFIIIWLTEKQAR